METKANYVLIGLFTLAGIIGALGFLLWFAKVEVDKQYAYYDVLFSDVSGLGSASDVRYNGLPVGQVIAIELDEEDSSKVRVTLEVSAETPVNTETVAKLQSQGVTGVSFVGLSGGSDSSAPLSNGAVIPSERTALQSVFEGAPVLLDRAVVLLENVNDVFDTENKEAVSTLLANLASASNRVDTVLQDFESLSGDLGSAAREIATFTKRLESLADTAETTLTTATGTLETTNDTVATIGEFTTANLVPLADELRVATETANRVIDDVGGQAAEISTQISDLTARGAVVLDGAALTLGTANETFASANAAIDGIEEFRTNNLVPLSDDLRTTAQTTNRVIAEAGSEVQRISGRIDTLANQGGLALDSATVALDEAQITIRDARTTVARANTYIDEQLTPLTRDVRATAQTANRVIDEVGGQASEVATQINDLTARGTVVLDGAAQTLSTANEAFVSANTAITGIDDFRTNNLVPLSDDLRTTAQTANRVITEAGSEVQRISGRIDTLADQGSVALDSATVALGEAQITIKEARSAVARANTYIDEQLTPLTRDVRTTAQTANRVIDDVGSRANVVADRFITFADDGTELIAVANQTFANSDVTLAAIYEAMEDASATLATANKTFESANQIIASADIDGIINDFRGAAAAVTSTINRASGSIDVVAEQVVLAATSAANLTGSLEEIVQNNQRQLSDFLRLGLPSLLKFTDEANRLVANIDRLVNKVERDPARFLLGTQNSRFDR